MQILGLYRVPRAHYRRVVLTIIAPELAQGWEDIKVI